MKLRLLLLALLAGTYMMTARQGPVGGGVCGDDEDCVPWRQMNDCHGQPPADAQCGPPYDSNDFGQCTCDCG